jgi:D-erythrulose 1-phosphate 3-epimerase
MMSNMPSPRIHLAIDNCFASKRWCRPQAWAKEIAALGLRCVEASADNELDPLYLGAGYMQDWVDQVRQAEQEHGIKVVNLYSGHGTYATLGLAQHDQRVRDRFLHDWLLPMARQAEALNAGLGFFCHAFSQEILYDPRQYDDSYQGLVASLSRLTSVMGRRVTMGVEQMYTPHQVPWTIDGCEQLLRQVFAQSGAPFHTTIDTGHASGQRRFLRPEAPQVRAALAGDRSVWLGGDSAAQQCCDRYQGQCSEQAVAEILELVERDAPLFAQNEDGDTYAWMRRLAPWSPIVHLQQTDGAKSAHWPFTAEFNAQGIITGERLLSAVAAGYRRPQPADLPPAVEDIYLTLEIFSSTADTPQAIRQRLAESVAYWRQFVPEDGLVLDELLARRQVALS